MSRNCRFRVPVRSPLTYFLALKSFRAFGTHSAWWPRRTTRAIIAPGTWEAPNSWGTLEERGQG